MLSRGCGCVVEEWVWRQTRGGVERVEINEWIEVANGIVRRLREEVWWDGGWRRRKWEWWRMVW